MIDPFYTRPLAHSFKTRYPFTCRFCKAEASSPNRRAVSCDQPECRKKSVAESRKKTRSRAK